MNWAPLEINTGRIEQRERRAECLVKKIIHSFPLNDDDVHDDKDGDCG